MIPTRSQIQAYTTDRLVDAAEYWDGLCQWASSQRSAVLASLAELELELGRERRSAAREARRARGRPSSVRGRCRVRRQTGGVSPGMPCGRGSLDSQDGRPGSDQRPLLRHFDENSANAQLEASSSATDFENLQRCRHPRGVSRQAAWAV